MGRLNILKLSNVFNQLKTISLKFTFKKPDMPGKISNENCTRSPQLQDIKKIEDLNKFRDVSCLWI